MCSYTHTASGLCDSLGEAKHPPLPVGQRERGEIRLMPFGLSMLREMLLSSVASSESASSVCLLDRQKTETVSL